MSRDRWTLRALSERQKKNRIMPPNMTHCVYNPVAAAAEGGHFLMYDTMRLTRFAIQQDMLLSHQQVNDIHGGFPWVLDCMMQHLCTEHVGGRSKPGARAVSTLTALGQSRRLSWGPNSMNCSKRTHWR